MPFIDNGNFIRITNTFHTNNIVSWQYTGFSPLLLIWNRTTVGNQMTRWRFPLSFNNFRKLVVSHFFPELVYLKRKVPLPAHLKPCSTKERCLTQGHAAGNSQLDLIARKSLSNFPFPLINVFWFGHGFSYKLVCLLTSFLCFPLCRIWYVKSLSHHLFSW